MTSENVVLVNEQAIFSLYMFYFHNFFPPFITSKNVQKEYFEKSNHVSNEFTLKSKQILII